MREDKIIEGLQWISDAQANKDAKPTEQEEAQRRVLCNRAATLMDKFCGLSDQQGRRHQLEFLQVLQPDERLRAVSARLPADAYKDKLEAPEGTVLAKTTTLAVQDASIEFTKPGKYLYVPSVFLITEIGFMAEGASRATHFPLPAWQAIERSHPRALPPIFRILKYAQMTESAEQALHIREAALPWGDRILDMAAGIEELELYLARIHAAEAEAG